MLLNKIPEKAVKEYSAYSAEDLSYLTAIFKKNNPQWKSKYSAPEYTVKSKTYENLFNAVKDAQTVSAIFQNASIVDKNNKLVKKETLAAINSHNRLVKDIKSKICASLLNKTSVLLQERNGIDYSINTSTKKPFEDIQQLYLQQLRKDRNLQSPYFMPSGDVKNNGFTLKKNSMATALSHINKYAHRIDFSYYFSAEDLQTNKNTLEISQEMLTSDINVPYTKQEEIPPVLSYEPKTFSLEEQFNKHISDYFKSCYTGEPYNPPQYSEEELQKIVNYISYDNSDFFKNTQKAHRCIKNSLSKPVKKRQRDKARVR